ncbi:hypothetical protein ALGA_2925 [Labilibaculum antarcticum]|uniref:Uncharacterized protein n=1 Tax=Labilibaculum antarcticum TaxID=1717717 RepID=A0A1Y1CLQ6_9BACT|nr:hypothetical protein ALGA_2925 [Labilibaculum antarcticum]
MLGLSSCNTLRVNESEKPISEESISEDTLHYNTKFIDINSNNAASYECDNFVSNALDNYSIASIRQDYQFLKSSQKPKINIHNPAIIDTIYTFSDNKNIIQFYRTQSKDFIFNLDVTNSRFKFPGDITTGMSKDAFIRKFKITELINEKVQLNNSNGNATYLFYFKRNKLKRINANLYLD